MTRDFLVSMFMTASSVTGATLARWCIFESIHWLDPLTLIANATSVALVIRFIRKDDAKNISSN